MLSLSRGQGNVQGLEASRQRPRPRTSKCVLEDVLEAKDVLEDSTTACNVYGAHLCFIVFYSFISMLFNCSSFKPTLYANDSVLALPEKNVNCLQTMLNCELPIINIWLKSNQLSLTVNKTIFLFFTIKAKKKSFQLIKHIETKL